MPGAAATSECSGHGTDGPSGVRATVTVWHPCRVTDPLVAAHGFDLAPELRRRLRGEPPADALRWVESELGVRVVGARALDGGTSSAVHLLELDGAPRRAVLRRYVLDWVAEEPWIPPNEARVLRALADAPRVPAPRLLAADPDGSVTGTPTVVMSALPGEVVWDPTDRESWLRQLAEVLPVIHAVPVPAGLDAWEPYPPDPDDVPPAWSVCPRDWELAVEMYHGPAPDSDRVFVHRDYHPGNVLWTGGELSGVIDWVSSCVGPPEEDVAHCRANLAIHHGVEVADRFLAIWQDITGRRDYHPYWDLTNVVSMASEEADPGLDALVASAARRLRDTPP